MNRKQQGVALVEFALILPFLLVLSDHHRSNSAGRSGNTTH